MLVSGGSCISPTLQKALIVSRCVVSGCRINPPCCNCIRLQLYPLQLYPVAIVSHCIRGGFGTCIRVSGCSCISLSCRQLYLDCISKTPSFSFCIRLQLYRLQLYPVAIATRSCEQLYLDYSCRLPNPAFGRKNTTKNTPNFFRPSGEKTLKKFK